MSCESSVKMSAFCDCGVQSILSQTLVKWSKSWEDYYKPGKAKLSQKMGKIWANSIDLLPACLSLCVRLSWTCWYSLQSYRLFTFLISISDKPSLCPSEHPTTGSSASIVGFWFFYKILGWRGDTGLWTVDCSTHAEGWWWVVHHRAVVVLRTQQTVGKYLKVSPHSWHDVFIVYLDVSVPVFPGMLVSKAKHVHQLMLDDSCRTKYSNRTWKWGDWTRYRKIPPRKAKYPTTNLFFLPFLQQAFLLRTTGVTESANQPTLAPQPRPDV